MGILINNGIEYTNKPKLDKTLSVEGQAADSKAVGDTKISYTDVIDNLESTATDLPLSANQGQVLNEKINLCIQIVSFDATTGALVTKSVEG